MRQLAFPPPNRIVTSLEPLNEQAAEAIGVPMGSYLRLEKFSKDKTEVSFPGFKPTQCIFVPRPRGNVYEILIRSTEKHGLVWINGSQIEYGGERLLQHSDVISLSSSTSDRGNRTSLLAFKYGYSERVYCPATDDGGEMRIYDITNVLASDNASSTVVRMGKLLHHGIVRVKTVKISYYVSMHDVLPREAKTWKELHHPNILALLEGWKDVGAALYYMVSDFHEDLRGHIDARRLFSEPVVKSGIRQINSALSYLHARRIVHCDIRPENILVKSIEPIHFFVAGIGSAAPQVPLRMPDSADEDTDYIPPERFQKVRVGTYTDSYPVGILAMTLLSACRAYVDCERAKQIPVGEWLQTRKIRWDLISNFSPEASEFIKEVTRSNVTYRLTCARAITHPWLIDEATKSPQGSVDDKTVTGTPSVRGIKRTSSGCTGSESSSQGREQGRKSPRPVLKCGSEGGRRPSSSYATVGVTKSVDEFRKPIKRNRLD